MTFKFVVKAPEEKSVASNSPSLVHKSPKALVKKSRRKSMGDLYLGLRKKRQQEKQGKALIEVLEEEDAEMPDLGGGDGGRREEGVRRKKRSASVKRTNHMRSFFGSNPR